MSLHRSTSAAAGARAQQHRPSTARASAPAPVPVPATPAAAPPTRMERSLRQDPTLARSFRGHHGAVLSVAYSPVMLRASDTGLPGSTSSLEAVPLGGTSSSRARAQKASGSFVQQLASGGADHVVMLWHVRPQLRAFRFLGHSGPVNAVAFSADGTLLASASDDCTVRVWTPTAEGRSVVLRGHEKRVRSVAWAADNRWLLSTSDDQQCKLWDLSTGAAHSHFHGHTQAVTCCAFSPDNRLVATGSADRTVKLFDLQTQRCIQTFYHNTGVLASGCSDHSLKLWDLRTNELLQHYSAHDLPLTSLSFHPSGNFMLSTGMDGSIKLWDLRRGHQLYTVHGHPSPVFCGAFNAEGTAFVTGGGDQRVITWNVSLGGEGTAAKGGAPGWASASWAPLPQVGSVGQEASDLSASQRRRAGAAAPPARASQSTGQLSRNVPEPGRRDEGGQFFQGGGSCCGPVPTPEPSGPLPPPEMDRSLEPSAPMLYASQGRRGPPSYTFRTGENAGQVIGGRGLYVADGNDGCSGSGGAGAPSAPSEEDVQGGDGSSSIGGGDGVQGLGTCDYRHSHISRTSGAVHSYADVHDPLLLARAADRAAAQAQAYPGGGPDWEQQPLEEQMRGFDVPGLTGLAGTGRASTRSGRPGPSAHPASQDAVGGVGGGVGVPSSFAAAAAGVHPSQVHASISRGGGEGGGGGAGAGDDYLYSFQSDRFVPASLHPNQARCGDVSALKHAAAGVDIFAIPPADHVQRLPEQLAHTVKYISVQLEQISRAIHVFDYRMNLYEAKVERLERQQERWPAEDGI